jgi:hypothetical protein
VYDGEHRPCYAFSTPTYSPSPATPLPTQSFIKSILDVADNLERAAASVPADALSEEEGKALDAAQLRKLLRGLQEGVAATEKILLHVGVMRGASGVGEGWLS